MPTFVVIAQRGSDISDSNAKTDTTVSFDGEMCIYFIPSVRELYGNGRKALNHEEQCFVLGENTPRDV